MFQALSLDTRIRIIRLLRDRVLCVGALAARLELTPGAVSQHLRILSDAGLVIPEKRAQFVHYRLNPEALSQWQKEVQGLLTVNDRELPCLKLNPDPDSPDPEKGGQNV